MKSIDKGFHVMNVLYVLEANIKCILQLFLRQVSQLWETLPQPFFRKYSLTSVRKCSKPMSKKRAQSGKK